MTNEVEKRFKFLFSISTTESLQKKLEVFESFRLDENRYTQLVKEELKNRKAKLKRKERFAYLKRLKRQLQD